MLILPVMKDHLSWETTKFSGCFIQVSLYMGVDILAAYTESTE